ncbi:MAG: F0F1 ATP synthase subunit alpha [Clostridia bacterium]|nr:F0F1 ATP synthase subunit alpha [Clostridia bacterium]
MSMTPLDGSLNAVLFSAVRPTEEQEARFLSFLRERHGEQVSLTWQEDHTTGNGFRLVAGSQVYDWSEAGVLRQLETKLRSLSLSGGSFIPLLRDTVAEWSPEIFAEEVGTVLSVGDDIAMVSGLEHAAYGEILLFSSGIRGMVQELRRDRIGCILFGDAEAVTAGSTVRRTGRTAGMPVGEAFLGRVVDALGTPIDGKGSIRASAYQPLERPAPGIVDRQPVNEPMETGILTIDSMFPIGRGQRELIIGDRQTGKTAIALDVILNQKGKDVICIYVAIGQKASSVAHLAEVLTRKGAMDYTVIVNASASDTASLQYIAPYAGCALGEYFMDAGRDVLIVYDDLSKHAVAYRALSLLLERSPGREAYPGDVFYLHSRLLERSAHLSDEKGGGSMTALPIVETQAGDVSAYIPTNIISITDGQLFLESNLFFAGQRPAVNIGLSVSRVGGDAQTPLMKSAVGSLRLDLSQYREIEIFTQFSSDLDELTRRQLAYGQSLMALLRQPQYQPLSSADQVLLLTVAEARLLVGIPAGRMEQVKKDLLSYFHQNRPDLLRELIPERKLSTELRERIVAAASDCWKEQA